MNIILATDDNFVQHCCVAMTSVLLNDTDVQLYIFTEGLTQYNVELLTNQVVSYGGKIHICIVDSKIVSKFPMPTYADAHISIATYYRLFAAEILPQDIDKVIYMDCDMVARKSFAELWNTDIEGYALAAVYQNMGESQSRDKRRLLMPDNVGYFNAGLLLINLDYWRKYDVTENLFNFIREHYNLIKQHDQDVLNAVLYEKVKPISFTWNYLPFFFDIKRYKFQPFLNYDEPINNPANIHFVSAPKPWDIGCENPFRNEYYRVLGLTPFRGFKPKFVWKKYYNDVLRNKLLRNISRLDVLNLRKILKLRNLVTK